MKNIKDLCIHDKLVYLACEHIADTKGNLFTYKDLDFLGLHYNNLSTCVNRLHKKNYIIKLFIKAKLYIIVDRT
jgi:hypothetical protein